MHGGTSLLRDHHKHLQAMPGALKPHGHRRLRVLRAGRPGLLFTTVPKPVSGARTGRESGPGTLRTLPGGPTTLGVHPWAGGPSLALRPHLWPPSWCCPGHRLRGVREAQPLAHRESRRPSAAVTRALWPMPAPYALVLSVGSGRPAVRARGEPAEQAEDHPASRAAC